MQLKGFIKKKAAEKNISAQRVGQDIQKEFYIERRFLDFRNRWTGYTDNYGFGYDNKRFYANP